MFGRLSIATLNVYYPFHKLNSERQLHKLLERAEVPLETQTEMSDGRELNPNWGGVIEPNTFGTYEFLDFLDQIGAEAYLSVNVGSGSRQEAAEWLELSNHRSADDSGKRTRHQRTSCS